MAGPVLPTTAQPDAFLDTIPEDQAVAQQRVANLSAASAVASSDSEDETPNNKNSKRKKKRNRSKQDAPGSVSASSDAALVGGHEDGQEQSLSQASGSHPVTKKPMTKRRLVFLVVMVALAVLVTVGVGIVIVRVADENSSDESDEEPSGDSSDDAPSSSATFPPGFIIDLESEAPSPAPSLNPVDVAAIDATLLPIVSSTLAYEDPSTPEGKCRKWLTSTDQAELRVDLDGTEKVIQRFILCVLYEATDGPNAWNDPGFRDGSVDECEWIGVSCPSRGRVSWLFLPNLNLQGSIPEILSHLEDLQGLILETNNLEGSIPQSILDMEKLIFLDLSSNALTGTIPDGLSPLTFLDLGTNSLVGSVPFFPNMVNLRVQKNLLSSFDDRYSQLESLQRWKMYDNLMQGNLPQEWNAPNLQYIDLSENAWTGQIPSGMWNLPSLKTLVLHDANLTGMLPSSTVSRDWEYVWLYSNQLSGSIPENMGAQWVNLTELLLYDNFLTGAIDASHCENWAKISRIETDCAKTNLACSCCTVCYGEGDFDV